MNNSELIADFLIQTHAVKFSINPPFTYTSGLKSPIYLDNRKLISYPEIRKQLIEIYLDKINEIMAKEPIDMIAGTATAAIPMAAWIADRLNLPMVYVRSSAKGHGMKNQIEGELHSKQNVIIIEDHISTAKSLCNSIDAIREADGKVFYTLATTSYENAEAEKNIKERKVKSFYFASGQQITKKALQKGILSKEEKMQVDSWFENPSHWHAGVQAK